MKLTNQEQKVYDYIKEHPGCTSHDITRDTFIQKPCSNIVRMERKGVVVDRIGEKKYPGTKAFKMYSIGVPLTKRVSVVEIIDGVAHETFKEVEI
jgi:hypothetical protein